MKEIAAELLGVKPKSLKPFDVDDPYNPPNTLQGFICFHADHRYGSLVVIGVNGVETEPQVIRCMPKIKYPFGITDGGDRVYNWPKDWKAFHVFEKYDGTNICTYSYQDFHGEIYITHKTRLTPILRSNSSYGDFKGLWDICLKKHPNYREPHDILRGKMTACYEMYGYQNPHLVRYTNDIDAVLLLLIGQRSGSIYLTHNIIEKSLGEGEKDITQTYELWRELDQHSNSDLEEGDFAFEGKVFYVTCDNKTWEPVKCKPECIEQIHWSRGVIPYNSIYTTVVNALENMEYGELNRETVGELLAEEYSVDQIECSLIRIDKAIAAIVEHAQRVIRVRDRVSKYLELTGLKPPLDKVGIMRYLSKVFDKSEMRKVYSAVRELGFTQNERG